MEKEAGKYFIQQYSQQQYQHGGVGYTDAERILVNEGYLPIVLPHQEKKSFGNKFNRLVNVMNLARKIEKDSVVVFLFPVYARMYKLLLWFLLKRGVKLICFIADINGIKDGDKNELESDISFLRNFDHFIVHNENMKQWLDATLPGKHSSTIEFFDFLTPPASSAKAPGFDIAFAGNLAKSSFLEELYRLPASLHFHLYGPGQTEAMLAQKNVSWHGIEDPYSLPGKIKGSFGLLWDGSSIEGPGGSLGDYMHYITHHKPSLYILSGLPLIVPAAAGCATLITKYKIGFAISSLYEIEDKVKNTTDQDYRQMRTNMQQLAQKISTGGCLKEALAKLNDGLPHRHIET